MNGECRCWAGAKYLERTHVKLRDVISWEGGSVADSIKGNLYCLAREVAFLACGRVSLLITQVKQQRAWSALEWVPTTRYKMWQRSDSGVWWRPGSGRASVELWAFVTMMGWGFIQIRAWFRPGTTVVVVMNGGCRCWAGTKHPERTHVKLRGEASLRREKCDGQYKMELILPCQRASFSGDAVECLSWSRKLSNGERGQHLDGCPLHVTIVFN
jgi:hypothetical protein